SSLLNWLSNDGYIRENAQPTLRESSSENMAAELAVIELVLTAGFKIADLALNLMEWLKEAKVAAPIVITPPNGWATRVSPGDSDYQIRRALVGAPDPQKSTCVLIGVSEYGTLRELPQVQKNLAALRDVLLDPSIWGVPKDRLKTIDYPRSANEIHDAISNAAQDASETLLVYFAGHGLHDQQSGLLLALPDATGEKEDHTVRWRELAEVIGNAKARRKVVWLDCCYAGLALPGNEARPDEKDPSELRTAARTTDTYLLAATLEEAKAPDGGGCTAFTGELVNVLRNGIEPGRPTEEFLTLNSIHREVRIGLRARRLPEPSRDDPGLIGPLPQFHNNLERPPEASSQVDPAESVETDLEHGKKRRIRYAVGTGVVALVVVVAFIAYWFIPGPAVSGLDLAKYCSALTSG
ncbi:MAG: caspase family protein, partial [Acidobacteria bacterium]|nr:caspase family protein [Acidobacteriota bacterium]